MHDTSDPQKSKMPTRAVVGLGALAWTKGRGLIVFCDAMRMTSSAISKRNEFWWLGARWIRMMKSVAAAISEIGSLAPNCIRNLLT
jgi:hypothetical protein